MAGARTHERKIDFHGRDWSAHAQDHWLEFAGHPNFPDYLRVLFVAYGRHAANGHAVLERQELAYLLMRRDGTLPERRVVWRAVQRAVKLGYLAKGSQLLCLIVNQHDVQGGRGNPAAPCTRDHTRKENKVRDDSGRFTSNVRNNARPSAANVRTDSGPSTPRPSISLLTHHDTAAVS